jgi:hypothetical protein
VLKAEKAAIVARTALRYLCQILISDELVLRQKAKERLAAPNPRQVHA